jgi:medium-chain acyl-[acyl-carrier-protein] hydrolase
VKLVRFNTGPEVCLRLFAFPHAAGSIRLFRSWPSYLPNFVEVWSVELPGRDSLINLKPYYSLHPMVEHLTSLVGARLDCAFTFFGHSMGALLCFELARELRRRSWAQPEAIFVAGHRAAHLPDPRPPIRALPEDELIRELKRLDGTPQEVLNDPELVQLFLPAIRADMTVCETYEYTAEPPLACPIVAFGGANDREIAPDEIAAWAEETRAGFRLRMLPGGHFFLRTAKADLLNLLGQELTAIRTCNLAERGS